MKFVIKYTMLLNIEKYVKVIKEICFKNELSKMNYIF